MLSRHDSFRARRSRARIRRNAATRFIVSSAHQTTLQPRRVYIPVLNPVNGKSHVSPREAERLVYYGHAAFAVVDGKRYLRYFAAAEAVALRQELNASYAVL